MSKYIFVLDYLDSKVYRYRFSDTLPFESYEEFLTEAGHSMSNIEWMTTEHENIEYGN
jgi:hypothetical protein